MTTRNHDTDDRTAHGGPRLALLDERGRVLAATAPLPQLPGRADATPLRVHATIHTGECRSAGRRLVTARPRAPLGV